MPRIVKTIVYELRELSEAARERARAWYRDNCLDYDWYQFVYEDFETVCDILGVTLRTGPVRLMGGGTREKPNIYFQGFWSQGDGASFEGSYRYAPGSVRAIRAHAPKDSELHAIADALQRVQRPNFYQLVADSRQRGYYCHEYTMAIAVDRDSRTGQATTDDSEGAVVEALRDLARWLYRQLEREYNYQTSDAVVDDNIDANEWTFTAVGAQFG